MSKNCGRARAIADRISHLLGRLSNHLRAQVGFRILEFHLFGNGDAVVADDRFPPFFLSTHLDLGPRVTRTASASSEAPCRIFSRAAVLKRSCLKAMASFGLKIHEKQRRRIAGTPGLIAGWNRLFRA